MITVVDKYLRFRFCKTGSSLSDWSCLDAGRVDWVWDLGWMWNLMEQHLQFVAGDCIDQQKNCLPLAYCDVKCRRNALCM